jgi:transcriptional regulator
LVKEVAPMALLKGTLDALVLKALSFGPRHGFQVIRWIEDGSGGEFTIEGAALLQALHRLEAQSLVTGSWAVTENNRRARYYSLTTAGRARLKTEAAELRTAAAALAALLETRTVAVERSR